MDISLAEVEVEVEVEVLLSLKDKLSWVVANYLVIEM